MSDRTVIVDDALRWLDDPSVTGAGLITSPPDAAEVDLDLSTWMDWYRTALGATLAYLSGDAIGVIRCTDRKHGGRLWSKAYVTMDVADALDVRLLWHKVAYHREPGKVDIHRPSYSHLLAFSHHAGSGRATPDVIDAGDRLYADGMGWREAFVAVDAVARTRSTVVDPFCGRGTVLAAANARGLDAVGVDVDPDQAVHARAAEAP